MVCLGKNSSLVLALRFSRVFVYSLAHINRVIFCIFEHESIIWFHQILHKISIKANSLLCQTIYWCNSFDIIYLSNWLVNGPPFELFASHTNTYTTYAAFVGFLFKNDSTSTGTLVEIGLKTIFIPCWGVLFLLSDSSKPRFLKINEAF